eukprot:304336_1
MSDSNSHMYAPVAGSVNHADLGERFIAAVADTTSSKAEPYLEVRAPATLPEGYTFEVEINGHTFPVKVPVGGVEEDQVFNVPFPAGSDTGYAAAAIPRTSVPVGHWKDDVFDCCTLGCIHPVLWNACCCPMVLLGQVMTRLKLTWLGNEGEDAPGQAASTFCIMLGITIFYQVVNQILAFMQVASLDKYGQPTDSYFTFLYGRLIFIQTIAIFLMILVCKTRQRIRNKYSIPEQSCNGCEDCCCAYWCGCCTIAQMARHTAEYEIYAGVCCSETGMPPHAPSIV